MTEKKLYELTDEHRAQLKPWAEKWTANALRTRPSDETDKIEMWEAMCGLYMAAKLTPPDRHIYVPSPICGAIAASIASGVWWLRENPAKHVELFGHVVTDAELDESWRLAAKHVVRCGLAATRGEPEPAKSGGTEPQEERVWMAGGAVVSAIAQAIRVDDQSRETYTPRGRGISDDAAARFLVECTARWGRLWNGGNQWSGWVAYLSFFRHVAKLDLPEYENFAHYEKAAIHGGPRFMHSKFWMVSDFPNRIHRDARNRPHCDDGPFTAWSDGWALYQVHGFRVPADVLENPASVTVERIEKELNVELRRIMIERYGVAKFMRDANAEAVQSDEYGTLYVRKFPDGTQTVSVHVVNGTVEPDGTRREFWLRVHPELCPLTDPADPSSRLGEPQEMTALNAVASTYRMRGEDYAKNLLART